MYIKKSYFELWYYNRANSCPIENCSAYFTFITDTLNFHRHHLLCKDNRIVLKKIWGKPDTYWKGSEFYFHIWIREFENEKFLIMTAKGKGTCIEICDTSLDEINSKKDIILNFTNDLYNLISIV